MFQVNSFSSETSKRNPLQCQECWFTLLLEDIRIKIGLPPCTNIFVKINVCCFLICSHRKLWNV